MSLGYRPLVFFWIAEYNDGFALPQFDPETGKENLFRDVDHMKLRRFGWYPFSVELAAKIEQASGLIVIPTNNTTHIIELSPGEKLVAKRENTIKIHRRSGVSRGETVYVLGKEGDKILRIQENGSVEE